MNTPEFIVGSRPESPTAPAHFFIAHQDHAVCCQPLDPHHIDPDTFIQMAETAWHELTGADEATNQLIGAIVIGWIDALRAHMIETMERNETRH